MKAFHWVLGSFVTILLLFILLVTSVEATIYWNPNYFEKEYRKYHVAEGIKMEMDDLLVVTDEMMGYLRDNRETLEIPTVINGEEREFFNDREKAHMADVKNLFVKAETLRKWFLVVVVLGILFFVKRKLMETFFRVARWTLVSVCGIFVCLATLIFSDFYKYFTVFHKIFFRNNLWILYPETDLLINIVPEPFFIDTAVRIVGLFFVGIVGLFLMATYWLHTHKQKK